MAHIHLSIPEDVREKIGQYRGRVNWSQVATAAFRKTIAEIEETDQAVEQFLNRAGTASPIGIEEVTPSAGEPVPPNGDSPALVRSDISQ